MSHHDLRSRAFWVFGFIFVICSLVGIALAQSGVFITATDDDTLIEDANGNGLGDPGDIIRYTVEIANCGFDSDTARDVRYQTDIDDNTTLTGSAAVGEIRSIKSDICGLIVDPTDAPVEPEPATPVPSVDATATDDTISVSNGTNNTGNITTNDVGEAPIQVISFGDSVANVGTTPADGATVLSIVAGSGTVDVTIDSNGDIEVTANGTTGTGTVTIYYEIQAGNGTTDIGQIDITFGDFPTAQDDTLATLGAGNEYTTDSGVTLNVPTGTGLLNNDTLGSPAATLVNWGGGDASASVDVAPGASRPFAGGTLTVNADGSFDLVNPTTSGVFTFDYSLDNGIGTSQATAEIYISEAPTAVADNYTVAIGNVDSSNTVTTNDTLGAPPAVVDFYADAGDIGGASQVAAPGVYTHPTGGFTVTIDAAGNLTIDASVGGVVAGNGYTFDYQITNAGGSSVATVTVDIVEAPVPVADAYSFLFSADQNVAAGTGLLVNDAVGSPAGTIDFFGGGDLGGSVTENMAGSPASASLGGGTLTINTDGSWTLTGADFIPGSYTFDYQVTNAFGSGTATVTFTIQAPPTAQDDNPAAPTHQVTLGNTLTIPVGADDLLQNTDPNGADDLGFPLAQITTFGPTCTETAAGNAGSTDQSSGLTVNADGSFSYTPTVLGSGSHAFCYTLSNGVAPDSTANVTITVVEGPTAVDDTAATRASGSRYNTLINTSFNSDGATFPHLLDNDTLGSPVATLAEVDGNSVTVGTPITVTNGTVTITNDTTGAFSFAPTNGFTGTASFDYTLTNPNGTSTATAEVYVNERPTANDDNTPVGGQPAYIVSGAGPFNFPTGSLFADNGAGADVLGTPNAVITSFGPSTGAETTAGNTGDTSLEAGILTVNADGSFSINPTALGDHVFVYELENIDNNGNVVGIDTATVTIRLQQAPSAVDDTDTTLASGNRYNTLINTNFSSDGATFPHLLDNDSLGSPTSTLTQVDGNAIGSSIAVTNGTVTITDDTTGAFTFAPAAGFTGTASFTYTIENGTTPSTATVEINVNEAPTANDDNTPVGGQPAYIVSGAGPFNFPTGSLFADNGAGADVLGTPNAVITSFGPSTGAETTAGNTGDTSLEAGILTINADGSFSINPTVVGDHVFVYELENIDSNGNVVGTDTATVTIRVELAPTAEDDTFDINFDDASPMISGDLNSANGGAADNLGSPAAAVTQISGAFGTATTPASVAFAGGTLDVAADGTISLTNAGNLTPGQFTFTYILSNSAGSDTATVTVNIYAPPTAIADAITVGIGSSTTQAAATGLRNTNDDYTLPNVYDDATITAASDVDNPPSALTIGTPYSIPGTGDATITINADGSYTVDATAATVGGVFNLDYTLSNSHPTTSTAAITVTIQTPPNGFNDSGALVLGGTSAPGDPFHVALNAASATIGNLYVDNGGFGADILGSPSAPTDAPADNINNVVLAGTPDGGAGTIGGGNITIGGGGTINVATNGDFTFEPPTGFTGLATFDYTLANSIGSDSNPATVTVAVGNRPVCTADVYSATGNIPIDTTNVAGNSVLVNDAGDAIAVTQVQGGANVGTDTATTQGGTVNMTADGEFVYTPPTGFTGDDTFTYAISNGFGQATPCTVTISVSDLIYFMDSAATAGGDGTLANPFSSVADHNGAPPVANSFLYVEDNGNFYTGTMRLVSGQTVIGEGSLGTLFGAGSRTGITLAPLATMPYSLTGNQADWAQFSSGTDAITINANNTLTGVTVGNTTGYAFVDNGASVGTTTITESAINGEGGLLNLTNSGVITATFDEMASTTFNGSPLVLTNMNGSIQSTTGSVLNSASADTIQVTGGSVFMTLGTSFNKSGGANTLLEVAGSHTGTLTFNGTMSASAGDGMLFDNADGTYTLNNRLTLNGTSAGVNIQNGSDGSLSVLSTLSEIRGIQGIPFRINNSTMAVDYDGSITHTQGAASLLSARVVEIIGGTGGISFDGLIVQGSNITAATAEMVYLENTGNANTISFDYIDAVTRDTSTFVSNTSGNVSANRFRLRCQGDLTVGGDTHCIQISDTISSGFTIESMNIVTDQSGDNGGAISLVNTPGVWTIEDTTLGVAGRLQTFIFGNNFGTLNIATVNSSTSPGAPAIGGLVNDSGAVIDLTNGTVNINATQVTASNVPDQGISLVNVDGPLFRLSGNVTISAVATANENIYLEDVTTANVDIGTDGSTAANVDLLNRQTFGVTVTSAVTPTPTIEFGDTFIPDPNATGLPQTNTGSYGGTITFNSLTP